MSTSIAFHENVSTKHIGFFRIFQMEKTSLHVMYAMFFPFETFIKNPTSFGNVFVKRYTRENLDFYQLWFGSVFHFWNQVIFPLRKFSLFPQIPLLDWTQVPYNPGIHLAFFSTVRAKGMFSL